MIRLRCLVTLFALLSAPGAFAQRPGADQLKNQAMEGVEARRKLVQEITDSLFSFSELGYQEYESSKYLTEILKRHGFRITRGVAGMPTAFVAEWGEGKPVIGFMSDIDGLPETSQKPGVAYHAPLIEGGPGHGEGHNAGQAVNVTAVLAVRDLLEKYKIPGTIRVYPGIAEELLGSRTYMVREGLFHDLDIMLGAHVANEFNTGYGIRGLALVSTEYTFHGRSAHGAGSPWKGRSALDAVELMNAGWNFRREHLRTQQRSHYVISHGGDQPNVVPPLASVWYFFRELDYAHVKDLHELGTKIAHGAAMMTGTTVSERVLGAAWQGHFNKPVAEALHANITKVGMPNWSEADIKLAKAIQTELDSDAEGLKTEVSELEGSQAVSSGSDDIAEVSWSVPTVVLRYPANIPGLIGHHWSSAVAMATPIAHKGATAGAKAQAMTAIELFVRPELVKQAQKYFSEQTKTTQWQSLIPDDVAPPTHLNAERMQRFRPALDKLRYDPGKYRTYLEQLGIKYPTIR